MRARLAWLTTDGRKILAARGLRAFAYGYVAIVLGAYLDQIGLTPLEIGILLTAAVAGSALMTVVWTVLADRVGRRRTGMIMAALMAVGGPVFALTSDFGVLLLGAFTGTISVTSSEVGVFQTIEQAILPQTVSDQRRTWLFSIYGVIGNFAGAIGSLAVGSVAAFAALGLAGADAYRPLFLLYGVVGLANLVLFGSLSPRVELARVDGKRRFLGIHRSGGIVKRLAALFAWDAFAAGFVSHALVAYWFYLQWGLEAGQLALLFFGVNIVGGVAVIGSGWLAGRIGLLNTMLFGHAGASVLLVFVPLMPTAGLAIVVYIGRTILSPIDVPARQSYTMAVVAPDERTPTAGVLNLARVAATALAPGPRATS